MKAWIAISLGSPAEAGIIQRAMSVDEKPGSRSSTIVKADKSTLTLAIEATDLGALRAALNSSLRQVKIASDSIL